MERGKRISNIEPRLTASGQARNVKHRREEYSGNHARTLCGSILGADRTLIREPQRAANSSATGLANSVKSFVLVAMIIIFTKKFSLASLV